MKIDIKKNLKLAKEDYDKGEWRSSLSRVQEVLKKFPGHLESLDLQFDSLVKLQDWIGCSTAIKKLVEVKPTAKNLINKGCVHIVRSEFKEAIKSFELAEKKTKNDFLLSINKGIALRNVYRYSEAIQSLTLAKELVKNDPYPYMHLGIAFAELNQYELAIREYIQAIKLDRENGDIHWNLSLALLAMGDYDNGWKEHEWRFFQRQQQIIFNVSTKAPLWDLKTFTPGMKLCVETEQGIGDFIQFSRFIKVLADKGVKVTLAVTRDLYELAKQVEGVDNVFVPNMFPEPNVDCYCYMCSLPVALGINLQNLPAPVSTFKAPADKINFWKNKLANSGKPKVGIVWAGNPGHGLDFRRSIPLDQFITALPNDIDYFCLSKDLSGKDIDLCEKNNIKYLGREIFDWLDTEAIIEEMDLVVSVSTSVPALSASMGKDTWVLVSYSSDWRWLFGRTDSPWFPSVTVYRQDVPGYDWTSVLNNVKKDLTDRFLGGIINT